MKKFLIIAAIIAVVGGIWWLGRDEANAPSDNASLSNNVYGNADSGIELVEFGDFECPSCGQFYPVVKQVKEKYKDQIQFRFRHFPLQTIHPNARAAHRAAQAAANQGKFWEMHDLMYENQASWRGSNNASAVFETYAGQLGLDADKFKRDAASSEVNSIINADVNLAGSLNVTGTPTFFLNDKQLENNDVSTVEKFSQIIDALIAEKASTQQPAGQ